MMRLPPFVLVALGVVTLAAGCAGDPPPNPRDRDWNSLRQSDVSCLHATRTERPEFYPMNSDASDEVFLIQRCASASDRPGEQLEVVDGSEDPATTHPRKLVLQEPSETVDHLHFCNGWAIYRVTRNGKARDWRVRWSVETKTLGTPAAAPPHECQ
jgi:hypothetical protein